jgi:hypothetical protein
LTSDYRSRVTGRALQSGTADDYISRLGNLQTLLQMTLENAEPTVLRSVIAELKQNPVVTAARLPAFVTDVGSALRAYADFLEIHAGNFQVALQEFETEIQVTIEARRGQERFRAELFRYWQGRCVLTDIDRPALLRASHIKPWSVSSNAERMDPFNGLLLVAHLDALFDRVLISFGDAGEMLVSSGMTDRERTIFGLPPPRQVIPLTPAHRGYMCHHRERFAAGA